MIISGICLNEIHILPDFIANQIAAGEVVQRPESVVKELVENSLDSGADTIAVVVRNAGKQLIHVIDNGRGIHQEDLPLTIKRHATSKIVTQEDMENILTYGFRGEALASICSVANLEIRTKRQGDELGWQLESEPNKPEQLSPINTDCGTQVFVKNLFYNIPARKKFLKSNLTEFRHISDTMIKFALSRTDIRFTFYDGDTLIFDVKPSELRERIGAVLGGNIADNLIPVYYGNESIEVSGFVGEPNLAKQSNALQYLFLNGRSIRSKYLNHAVAAAYEFLIEKSYYPFYLLNLKIDPRFIDINVHPQKHEVKFEDERYVYNVVNKAALQALNERNLIPDLSVLGTDLKSPFSSPVAGWGEDKKEIINKLTGEIVEPFSRGGGSGSGFSRPFSPEFSRQPGVSPTNRDQGQCITERELSAFDAIFGGQNSPAKDNAEQQRESVLLKQVLDNYIMVVTPDRILLIDQHRAHTRVLYDRLMGRMAKTGGLSQPILYPLDLPLTPVELSVAEEIREDLEKMGFEFSVEPERLVVTGIPNDIRNGTELNVLKDIIAGFMERGSLDDSERKHRIAMYYALRSAVEPGAKLSDQEVQAIYYELVANPSNGFTPDGKTLMVELTHGKLSSQF